MNALTKRLFVDAAKAFAGGTVTIAPVTVGGKTVDYSLQVRHNGKNAEFFMNKNIVNVDGRIIEMEGVAHYNQGNGIFYIPAQGVAIVAGK